MAQRTKLTLKQERFAKAYIVDGNATEATIKAGYNVKNRDVAAAVGSEVLTVPKVQAAIQDWRAFLEDQIMPSLQVVKDLAQTAEDPRVRLAASKDLLARAGVGKQVQNQKNVINVFASMDEGLLLQKMAQLVGNNSANVSAKADDVSPNIHCQTLSTTEKKEEPKSAQDAEEKT